MSLLKHYKTYKNDIIKEFYTPVLKQAVLYQRAVGFFSSTALIDLTKGISGMIKNGGRIQFIVSPLLSQEDIDAINKGYEKKKIIGEALMREFREPENYFQEERLKDYFGEKCIEYDLNRAIKEKKLTPYYYYPR